MSEDTCRTDPAPATGQGAETVFVPLPARAVLRVAGADAHGFLQNLLTCDMDAVDATGAGYGALLTPQGKILFDFLVMPADGGYLLDTWRETANELARRLGFYKLRSKVDIADASETLTVAAAFGRKPEAESCLVVADPRLAGFGWRVIGPPVIVGALAGGETEASYHARRVAFGLPEAPFDFALGDAFPHDADMDDLNGVAFDKGCFIGQEVVSRMRHRGTARRRIVQVTGARDLPATGTEILAGDKPAGTLGTVAGSAGLALVRLDRIAQARARGEPVTAGGVPMEPALPAFARFAWPEPSASAETAE
ncbi:folate-binding protein YgfZ [Stappia sp. P2PMeth1]|uniref:CAF17-like 4Fe-4S cluster assembly/insertion protein YgfZ n=1 Tax=Stappia sp. P2PMeth1 TaxID=2003586 RepID=UPI001645B54F|nr:folate-binding protein YgfZ [Stappia sp. P2PMeth1]